MSQTIIYLSVIIIIIILLLVWAHDGTHISDEYERSRCDPPRLCDDDDDTTLNVGNRTVLPACTTVPLLYGKQIHK